MLQTTAVELDQNMSTTMLGTSSTNMTCFQTLLLDINRFLLVVCTPAVVAMGTLIDVLQQPKYMYCRLTDLSHLVAQLFKKRR